MRVLRRVVVLVALWLLAWGDVTVANLTSGIVAASALLIAFPPRRPDDRGVRLDVRGVARLAAYVASQLVRSNITMTRLIFAPPTTVAPGVLAHRLQRPSDEVITLVSSIIALSPGTMTVDVDADSSCIYVHFFHLDDPAAARASIAHLERLAIGAIPHQREVATAAGPIEEGT